MTIAWHGTAERRETQRACDERLMRHALALGRRHLGLTWPNPSVGALVVRDTPDGPVIVACAATQPSGRPHAERLALDLAGKAARGATLYVSLEPCCHHGLTPPCVDAIIAAGIVRVVTGLEDPDPRVAGGGHARLAAAGLVVETPVLEAEARASHLGHILRVTQRRPMVTVKLAQTADGFAARTDDARLRITGRAADAAVHMMRRHADAVMVGGGTAISDDPRLTVRLPGLDGRNSVRIVVDSDLGFAPFAPNLVDGARDVPTWVLTTDAAPEPLAATLMGKGITVIRVGADTTGRVDLAAGLEALAGAGLTRILCEGGPHLAESLAEGGFVDEVVVLTGPEALGIPGEPALRASLSLALGQDMDKVEDRALGHDRLTRFTRRR